MSQRQGSLLIVCGLLGSGKTSQAKALALEMNAFRLSADDWMEALSISLWDDVRSRVEALQWDLAQGLLKHGQTVIIEWGTWARSERDSLREGARALGADVELHYLSEDVDVLWNRVEARALESPPITREQLEEWAETFEVPTDEELALYDPSH